MKNKHVIVVDINGETYEYEGVSIACKECPLPVWYGIYPNRKVSKIHEENFNKIAFVKVEDTVRYEKNSSYTKCEENEFENMVKKFATFLENEGILPIENWASFKIKHCKPQDYQEKKSKFNFIKSQVGSKQGIYIYVKDEQILYIGKGKPLYKRIKDHYIESFKPIPDDAKLKDSRWDRFFSQNNGEVQVFWKEFKLEEERQLIEITLTKLLKPTFLKFR